MTPGVTALSPAALLLALAGLAGGLLLALDAWRGARAARLERDSATSLHTDGPPRDGTPDSSPPVTVLVPARNEATRIGPCVASLLGLDYPGLEIIVVDDGSTDGTAEVARATARRDPRLRVVPAGPLPAGWVGKSHALWEGQARARGEWLLFTDADTRHAPQSLRLAVAEARARGAGLLSLTGRQEAVSRVERLVQPRVFEFLARRFPLAAVNDPADPRAAANGQYLLVVRPVYDAIGGHAAVRGEILEDVALARLAKSAGHRVVFLSAPGLLSVRMYDGARALLEGWTKNLADLAGGPRRALGEAAVLLLRGAGPPAVLLVGLAWLASGRLDLALGPLAFALVALPAVIAAAAGDARLGRRPASDALLAPLGAVLAALLFARSAWRRSGARRVVWRGRRYDAAPAWQDRGPDAAAGPATPAGRPLRGDPAEWR